jgi:hypothetical protein
VTAAAHVDARRILERVMRLPEVRPLRLFPLLLPMWGVEIQATIREAQPYELFDRYLSRAVAEAGLIDASALADFFGVEPALVERGLRYLDTIGHLDRTGETLRMTDLGYRSVADGCRYVVKEDRQILYFDGFAGRPLTRGHYSGAVWLDEPRLTLKGGTRFQPVAGAPWFPTGAVDELMARPDRAQFNIPDGLDRAAVAQVGSAWLPAYVVECVDRLLVFVKAIDEPDPYLGWVAEQYLAQVLADEPRPDDLGIWREWLAGKGFADVRPERMGNGVLRAVLPGRVFGNRIAWWQLGSFECRKQTFMQLWCDDAAVRRRGVLERGRAMVRAGGVRDAAVLGARLSELAEQLAVEPPDGDELLKHAREQDDAVAATVLERL